VHAIEPYYNWRELYISSEDPDSPFYGRVHSEFEFSDKIYNYYIHPQWDNIGSPSLFIKVLYTDYHEGFTIIEFIGEWNDLLNNDIMILKRDFIDPMLDLGIGKFILIGENILNFHGSDDCYYEEWFDDLDLGWVCLVNFRDHVLNEMQQVGIDQYFLMGKMLSDYAWRTMKPTDFFIRVEEVIQKKLPHF